MNFNLAFLLMAILFVSSCGVIRKTPKTEFKDGLYTQYDGKVKRKVYIEIEEGLLKIRETRIQNKQIIVDTNTIIAVYPKEQNRLNNTPILFNKNSLDLDFLIMPLKYRPSQKAIPSQLNATLNGSVYVGYRTDKYLVRYELNPLKKSDRIIDHYGFSFGLFGGLGNTAMTPTTTNNFIATEYDGVIFSKGVAGIVAINNFTIGLSVGLDNLLDNNKKHWIYESKPWFGLALGLNLN
jgi:hypothetical protein